MMNNQADAIFWSQGTSLHISFSLPNASKALLIAVPHIVQTPGILGGKPRIAGRRISVQDIIIWHIHMQMGIDDIATEYDLALVDIHAALTYYALHRDDIDGAIQTQQAFAAEMQQRDASQFADKLKARRSG